ncbi:SDR family NAD(P)-dependent oxidoreductase [Alkalihalobacterium elongatum]|uniref:SDR family NAD(P)-dependent oxidoreductase n=1 Tax=Alkalihalobacterium elongatum TaxID=2675466 RepID=UPI001C1FE775|nr:3-oxoacyl-ACP reductase family protein [Alkalihalobacterium elongatum]
MKLFDLTNKVAIVTGGNRGLGRSMALALAEAGADVVIVGRDEQLNQQVVEEIERLGKKALGLSVNLRDVEAINNMILMVKDQFGKVDILVNNAGVSTTKFALEVTEQEWEQIMDLNVKSLFFCCQAAAKVMKEQGSGNIINIASVAGAVGDVGISPYTASKAAVINLTRSLALEWAKFGINVNAIGPAYIKTDMNRDALENENTFKKITGKTALKRLGQPQELSGAIILLASDASSYMTGQTIYVDGGWLAQ